MCFAAMATLRAAASGSPSVMWWIGPANSTTGWTLVPLDCSAMARRSVPAHRSQGWSESGEAATASVTFRPVTPVGIHRPTRLEGASGCIVAMRCVMARYTVIGPSSAPPAARAAVRMRGCRPGAKRSMHICPATKMVASQLPSRAML